MADIHYTITDLGILPGFSRVGAKALNDHGQIIGELWKASNSSHSFWWDQGQMHHVGKVSLNGINNLAQAVGTKYTHSRSSLGTLQAIFFQSGEVTPLLVDGSLISRAEAINDNSQVVGCVLTHPEKISTPAEMKYDGFLWQSGERRDLPLPPGYRAGEAIAVNNQDVTVGACKRIQQEGPMLKQAVLWNGDEVTLIGSPSGFEDSQAVAINNHGQVLVRAISRAHLQNNRPAFSHRHFLWHDGRKRGWRDALCAQSTIMGKSSAQMGG